MALTQASSSIEVIQSEVRYNQEPCNHDFTYCKIKAQEVLLTKFTTHPVKTLLQDLPRKGPFSSTPARSCEILQDPVRSCRILQESCRNLAQDSCKIPTKSRKILLDLAGVQEKRTFSWKILQ